MNTKRALLYILTSFVLFFLAATYITYPLLFHMGDLITGHGDELLIAWIQNWVIHVLMTNPASIFESNLYYPYPHTLAYTETFIVTSILAIPARFLTGAPIATLNFTLWSSIILLGFSIYLLCFYLTRNFLVSLLSGFLVVFSPAVLDCYVHVQFLSIECVPISLLFFIHFMKTQQSRYFALSLLFLIIQMYNSIMPGYFIAFSYLIIIFIYLKSKKMKVVRLFTVTNALLLILSLLLISFVAYPYFSVSQEFHYTRDIRDTIHFAFQPEDFLYPGDTTRLYDLLLTIPSNQHSQNNEFHAGYLGFVFTLLVLFTIWYWIKNFKRTSVFFTIFLSIALMAIVLSLGPVLHLGRHTVHKPFVIPLPYALLYYLVPGFNGLRDTARWNMLFIVSMAAAIAIMLNNLLAKYSLRRQALIYILLFIGIVAEYNFPWKFQTIAPFNTIPKVYTWLAITPTNSKIIEMPIYNWNSGPFALKEVWRDYYSIADFRKTVNGSSGFSPPPWQTFVVDLTEHFPDSKTILELKHLHINYIIVHADEYDACSKTTVCGSKGAKSGKVVLKQIAQSKSFTLIKTFGSTYVYTFR